MFNIALDPFFTLPYFFTYCCCRDGIKNLIFMASHHITREPMGGFEGNFIFQVLIKEQR